VFRLCIMAARAQKSPLTTNAPQWCNGENKMSNFKLDLSDKNIIHTLQSAVSEKASALYSAYWELHGTEDFTSSRGCHLMVERAEQLLAYAQLDVAYWTQSHKEWLALEDNDSAVDRATAAVRRAEIAKYKAICDERAEHLAEQNKMYLDAKRTERAEGNA